MAPSIDLDQPVQVLVDGLNEEQRQRTMALAVARALMATQKFGGKTLPSADDLIQVANWIVDGNDDSPLYPYADADGTMHLGPTVQMKPDGWVWVNGNLYEPSADDSHDEDSQDPEIGGTDA